MDCNLEKEKKKKPLPLREPIGQREIFNEYPSDH
jgi:hypothetical protein